MKIGILTKSENNYLVKRLKELASTTYQNQIEIIVLDPSKFCLTIETEKSVFFYKDQILDALDYIIPLLKPDCGEFNYNILKHFEHTKTRIINNTDTLLKCKNRFCILQNLKGIKGIKIPKTTIVQHSYDFKEGLKYTGNLPVLLKTSIPKNNVLDCVFLNDLSKADMFIDINFMFNKLINKDQSILIQEYIHNSEGKAYNYFILNSEIIAGYISQDYLLGNDNFEVLSRNNNEIMTSDAEYSDLVLKVAKEFGLNFGTISFLKSNNQAIFFDVNPLPDIEKIETDYKIDVSARLLRNLYF